jgi:hypothetical protein
LIVPISFRYASRDGYFSRSEVGVRSANLLFRCAQKGYQEIGAGLLRRFLFHHWDSRQNYRHVSTFARVNGHPPRNETYERLAAADFKDWRLELNGLVGKDLSFSSE